jgi:hypothetical protein
MVDLQLAATRATTWLRDRPKVLMSVLPDLSGEGSGTGWMSI